MLLLPSQRIRSTTAYTSGPRRIEMNAAAIVDDTIARFLSPFTFVQP
jgi:hypothetical protein